LTKFYNDYFWKEGKPYGLMASNSLENISYKIVADPYYKRISIEQYAGGNFIKNIYDSALFDFRHLQPIHQTAWQKTTVEEKEGFITCHIRKAYSPQGILISMQNIYYTSLQDSFDGVILCDSNSHPIMFKRYQWDAENEEFSDLIEECWDMSQKEQKNGGQPGLSKSFTF
jgi:hypothetical protein